ncbi:MAG TPA: transporter substrate-binding domain-containing protein [Trebonia sp.]|jgi:polar amino acid transport system substrate-binding protein|nr:transporter substrate-binding domain-containing protein [Trebonia sp.]
MRTPDPARTVVTDLAPRGVLRASINLGNPVLAQGTRADPAGVTVDIARELAARLDLPLELVCFDAARRSLQAMVKDEADICFLAIEPARAAEVAFTAPYVLIEGVYAVPADASFATAADADRDGVRIGVKRGSAYDLFLTRSLAHATIVRGEDNADMFLDVDANVVAGIREPMTGLVRAHPGWRLIDDRFMEIRQAVGTLKTKDATTVRFLCDLVEELKASGFIAESLRRSGQSAPVAPPA